MKYRKKPVEVEVIQFNGVRNFDEIKEFCGKSLMAETHQGREIIALHIITLEGTLYAYPGDYIIRGVKGEIYPCKPDIFEQTYEKVEGGE